MANNNETTTKFKVDISELKKNFQEASRQIRLANSEFKAATSGMDNWSKSADGISAKLKQLNSTLDAQKKQLQSLEQQYSLVVQEQGENSKGAQELMIKINNQKAAIGNTEKQIRNYNSTLAEMQSATEEVADRQDEAKTAMDRLKDSINQQEQDLIALKNQYSNLVLEQGESSDEAQELANQIDALSTQLNENRTKLNEAENAADEFDNTLEDLDEEADNTANGGLSVFGVALGNLIADVVMNAINKLKDLAAETINVGKQFDSSMSQVAAVSGATGKEYDQLRDKAKEMGANTKFSASEAADAFNYMAMAGWKTEDMLGGIEGVLNLAAASGSDLATTSDIVTDALTAMGYSAEDAGRLADVMAAASSNANTNVEMMGQTFKYAAPVVGALGYSMEDTAVAIGLMANAGIKAEQAGTSLRSIMSRLSAPPKECATAMDELGISLTDSEGNMKSLDEVMMDLRGAFDGLSETEQTAMAKHIAGQEAMSGLLAIVNAAPADFDKLTDAVANSEGAAEKMAKTMQDNLGGDLTTLGSKLEGTQIAIYEKFEPALRSGVDVLSKLLDAVNFVVEHSDEFIAALTGMATAIGAYLAYTTALKVMTEGWKALTIVTKLQTAAQAALNVVMNLNPIGLIVAAIAGLVAAFVVLWNKSEKFRNFWIGLWDSIQETLEPVFDFISGLFTKIVDFFKNNWQSILAFIVNPFAGVFKYLYDNFEGFRNFVDGVVEAVKGFFIEAGEKIKQAWNTVKEFFIGIWESIKEIFSTIAQWIYDNVFVPIMEFFQPVIDFFTTAFEIISQLAEGCWILIKTVWGIVKDWFSENVIEPVKQFFIDLWDGIKETASAAWDFIVNVWNIVSTWFNDNVIQPVKDFFTQMWDAIKSTAKTTWESIKGVWNVVSGWFNKTVVTPVKDFFKGMWDRLKSGAKDAWEGIKSVFAKVADWFEEKFKTAWEKVKAVFSTGGKIFDGIKDGIVDAFKTVVNAIIRGINKVIAIPFNAINDTLDNIRDISIAGVEPFKDLISRFDVPQIPELAQGGVLRKGQIGLLEGDGSEAVVPLEKNTGWLDEIAKRLYDKMNMPNNFASVGSNSTTVTNNFYQTNNSPKSLSRLEIYRQSKNLLRMKG